MPTPCPDPLPPGARWREVNTDEQPIGFVLLRSRRRSIGFVITDDGLRVTAPNWVTLGQIDDAVREKARWILNKLREWHARKRQLAMAHTRWQAGGELPYLGRRIVIGVGGDSRQAALRATPTPRGTATRCGWPCPPTPTRAASATPPRPGCNSAPAPGSARAWRISCRSAA